MPPRVLFVCKRRPANYGSSYGLLNSCRFLCNALHSLGAEAAVVEVIDNNFIDREVVKYDATHVFIEALWVVPDKFDVLLTLPRHQNRQWYVRLHSNTSFLANEGVAMRWITKYVEKQIQYPNFHIAPNSERLCDDLLLSLGIPTAYSPNVYYPDQYDFSDDPVEPKEPNVYKIGCFGAVRPLKNQLIQAMAAMRFAEKRGKLLEFHINHSRLEQNGENVYKNLVAMFEDSDHTLVEHGWLLHEDFIRVVRSMDMGLQVSFTETFNIVAADFTTHNIPIVVSKEIEWANFLYKADPTDIHSILSKMELAEAGKLIRLQTLNKWGLNSRNRDAVEVWRNLLGI